MHEYNDIIKELTFDNIDDFFNQIISYKGEYYNTFQKFIFRGHSSSDYELIPSALRKKDEQYLYKLAYISAEKGSIDWQIYAEYLILARFSLIADYQSLKVTQINALIDKRDFEIQYLHNKWIPEELHELAGLAQHYGCPTRLLDWSHNINTALYFALVDNIYKSKSLKPTTDYINIWCLNMYWIKHIDVLRHLKFIKPTYNSNKNLAAQEGVFTLWEGLNIDKLDELLRTNLNYEEKRTPLNILIYDACKEMRSLPDTLMYKISLPTNKLKELYEYLTCIKHKASKLFPGYGGVAKEIKEDLPFNLWVNQPIND